MSDNSALRSLHSNGQTTMVRDLFPSPPRVSYEVGTLLSISFFFLHCGRLSFTQALGPSTFHFCSPPNYQELAVTPQLRADVVTILFPRSYQPCDFTYRRLLSLFSPRSFLCSWPWAKQLPLFPAEFLQRSPESSPLVSQAVFFARHGL